MTGKGLYDEKKSSAKPAANSFAAAAARATRAPRLQGQAPQKEKREKSPSELGEEVLALVLEEDMAKSRQTAGGAAAANRKTAMGSQKMAPHGGFAEKAAVGNVKAAPYGGGFTAKNTGVRKETAPYCGAFAAANAAAKQQAAPYGGGFTVKNTGARKETTPYGGFTVKNTGIRKETAPYSGGAGRAAAQYEPPRYPPPAAGESAAPQALAAAGLDENAIRGARWRDDFSNAMQTIDKMTAPIRATPEWQAQAAAQDLSYAGLDANAQLGLGYGDGLFRLDQKLDEMTAPIRATPEWQAVVESQQLSGLGLDTAAQLGYDMGQPIGAWASQLVEDTHLAPGTSAWDFFGDKFKSGAAGNLEGAWNGIIDFGEALTRADLAQQAWQAQQYAWIGAPYRQYADAIAESTQIIDESLPQAAENLRSHRAAEYAQYIDELYGAGGLYRLGGDISEGVGQMVPTALLGALGGAPAGISYLYLSASGNAAAEARANGADEETAWLYGILRGGVEVGTEHIGGGIPGLNKGVLDDWLMGMAQSNTGRAVLKYAVNALGEGVEEFISEIAGAYLAKMWNGDERGVWQTFQETLPDAFYADFVGTLTSALMGLPGSVAEIGYARMVDTVWDSIKRGNLLSDAQSAKADASPQGLPDGAAMQNGLTGQEGLTPLPQDPALDAVERQGQEIEIQDVERDERNDLTAPENDKTVPESEILPNEEKGDMLSEKERAALGKALASIPPISSSLLNPEQQASLRAACRRTLKAVANLPRNTEVTMLLRMDMTPMETDEFIVGEPGAGRVEYTAPNEYFIAIHNHPDGRMFSEGDIMAFLGNDKYRIMVAVGYNGTVYVLEKPLNFGGTESALAYKFYRDFMAQHPNRTQDAETYIAAMQELIKGVEKYGIFYFSGGN